MEIKRKIILPLMCFFIYWPLFIIVALALLTYRTLVKVLASLFKHDLGRMLTPMSSLFALDTLETRPTCTVMSCIVLENHWDISDVKERGVNLVYSNGNPELRQTLTKWMGFHFWRWDTNFNPMNHFTHHDQLIEYSELLNILESELAYKPFPRSRPLWQLHIFSNVIKEGGVKVTVIALRFHHALMDGVSFHHVFEKFFGLEGKLVKAPPTPKGTTFQDKIEFFMKTIFLGPFDLYEATLRLKAMKNQNSPWFPRNPGPEGKTFTEHHLDHPVGISMNVVKDTGKKLKVQASLLIISAYIGALRRVMSPTEVNKYFLVTVPFPVKDHKSYPTNEFHLVHFYAPLETADPLERVKEIEKRLSDLMTSPRFLHTLWCQEIVCTLAAMELVPVSKALVGCGLLINFPMRGDNIFLRNANIFAQGGIPMGLQTVWMGCHTLAGKLSLRVVLDKDSGVATGQQDIEDIPKKIVTFMVEELGQLVKIANVADND